MNKINLLFVSILTISFSKKTKTPVFNLNYIEKNMVLIPQGSFISGIADSDYTDAAPNKLHTIKSFFMFNQEVCNGLFVWYLSEIKKNNDTLKLRMALPDTLVWRNKSAYNEPYVDYYLRHPAYSQYPLVGISYEQCIDFCKWLTQHYNNWSNRKFKKVEFDLPDQTQYEYAARGGLSATPFPWAGPDLQNKNGQWMANFKVIPQSSIYRRTINEPSVFNDSLISKTYLVAGQANISMSTWLTYSSDITAPVTSYWPNGYSLYNMSGNVEEIVHPKGKTMGGSWNDPGYYLQIGIYESYTESEGTSAERGFRFIMRVLEK